MAKHSNINLILRSWVRVTILMILSLLFALSILMIYFGKHPLKRASTPLYTYASSATSDYKVYLVPNDFYEDKYLGMDKQYTAALTDYIDLNFNYLFSGSLKSNIDYSYDVTATIIGEYANANNGKSELWTKKYILLDEQDMNMNDSTYFNANQNIKINYSEYNNEVVNFKEKFKIAIDAYLNVKMTVKYKANLIDTDNSVEDTNTMEINIPLGVNTFKITTNNNLTSNKSLTKEEMVKENPLMRYSGIALAIVTIITFDLLSMSILKSHKNQYKIALNKIMKDYSEIIVEVTNSMDFDNKKVITIKTFDDLVDIEEEIKSPILHYEVEHNQISWFIITTDEYIYKYILDRQNL